MKMVMSKVVPLFTKPFSSWILFLGYAEKKVYSMKIIDFSHMRECITSQCVEMTAMQNYSIEFTWIL